MVHGQTIPLQLPVIIGPREGWEGWEGFWRRATCARAGAEPFPKLSQPSHIQ